LIDLPCSEHRQWNMSRIRGKNTKPELLVRSILHRHGFRFRLHVASLPGKPDIVLPKYKIALFLHGCFWHMHGCKNSKIPSSRHDWWKEKLEANVRRDALQFEQLQSLGWNVLVVWECKFRRVSYEDFRISEENLIQELAQIVLRL
jgi:DNA mismatch endonuclease (patch repair protein)